MTSDSASESFQLTASRRGWPAPDLAIWYFQKYFNSQPHEEADAIVWSAIFNALAFQLTASRRGWRTEGFWRTQELYFNSQPHEEADIWPTLSPIRPIEFQLTASRIDWRYRQWYFLRKLCISTHSLTKRLTTRKFSEGLTTRYFNSQPHEEADETCSTIQNYYRRFQLTASRRGWRISPPSSSPCDHISTHSLTKRLTFSNLSLEGIHLLFQLTASRRGWLSARAVYGSSGLFQLTASRRGWHTGRPGADTVDFISTHSLTKRLTNIRFRRGCRCLFQLTASRRGWRKLSDCLKNARKFQLTASRRGWRWWLITPWSTPVFQLTASRRGWL